MRSDKYFYNDPNAPGYQSRFPHHILRGFSPFGYPPPTNITGSTYNSVADLAAVGMSWELTGIADFQGISSVGLQGVN